MAVLSLNAADSCKYLSAVINYPQTADVTLTESQRRKKIDEEVKRKGG